MEKSTWKQAGFFDYRNYIEKNKWKQRGLFQHRNYTESTWKHGVIILNRINNSRFSIETSAPQQAGGFIIKHYLGISNITVCR